MRCSLLILAIVLPVVACDIVGTDAEPLDGRYMLQAVNRSPLPYRFLPVGPDSTEVLAGFIQVRDTLVLWIGFTTRFKQNGTVRTLNDSSKLGWFQEGKSLTFFDSDGDLFPRTKLEDGAFDLITQDSTHVYSYRR
jgi:hypothetical protein